MLAQTLLRSIMTSSNQLSGIAGEHLPLHFTLLMVWVNSEYVREESNILLLVSVSTEEITRRSSRRKLNWTTRPTRVRLISTNLFKRTKFCLYKLTIKTVTRTRPNVRTCSMTQSRKSRVVNHEKAYFEAYWSYQVTSDVTWLETQNQTPVVLQIVTRKYERQGTSKVKPGLTKLICLDSSYRLFNHLNLTKGCSRT